MDKLHATMVNICDRLLLLLTGPQAVTDPAAAEAILQAIEFLQVLEGRLKGAEDQPVIDEAVLGHFLRRAEVSNHVAEVFGVLREQGLYHSQMAFGRH